MGMVMEAKPDHEVSRGTGAPRILVADPIAATGIQQLQAVAEVDVAVGILPEELVKRLAPCEGLVVRSETKVTADLLDAAPCLRVIGRAGVGVDNIDLEAATRRGILVLNSPAGNTIAAAEHVVAMMFALIRNIPEADHSMRTGAWDRKRFVGQELRGKTLGILGLGKIGSEVARMASAGIGMRVIACDPLVASARAELVGAHLVNFESLLGESDVLTVHVPLNRDTRAVVGLAEMRKMKRGARILNVARGGIVDEDALVRMIEDGHLAGAALDVFSQEPLPADSPLRRLEKAVLTPHLGASTEEAQVNVATDVALQIAAYFRGETPPHPVNAPSVLPEEMAQLRPYMDVAYRIGLFIAQMSAPPVREIACRYAGQLASLNTGLLTAEVLRGFLQKFIESRVNVVNAKLLAKGLGIAVSEHITTEETDHSEAITIEAFGSERLSVAGTEIAGFARITRVDDFRVDLHPEGTFLVVTHDDRPGVIAAISGGLAEEDVNIARIELGRDRPRGRAVLLMQVDDEISPALLTRLRTMGGLRSLRCIQL